MLRLPAVGVLHQRLERPFGRPARTESKASLRVAGDRVLDLDDVGAPVGEHRAGRRGEGELRHLHHLHALHGLEYHCRSPFGSRSEGAGRLRFEQTHVDIFVGELARPRSELEQDAIRVEEVQRAQKDAVVHLA